jgi:glycosyltransferase involved in cell wall biosynthesis
MDILMIALQFAPVQSTGAFRAIEFAKRLPAHNITPTVLTIEPNQAEKIFGAQRSSALADSIPDNADVMYLLSSVDPHPETPIRQLLRMLTTFDDTFERRFESDFLRKIGELKNSKVFSAVYATAPPFGAASLGATAARILGVPYLLDMRDAWAEWSPAPQISRLHLRRKRADEREAFANADKVVGVTRELTDLFAAKHPGLSSEKFEVIPNGTAAVDQIPEAVVWTDDKAQIDVGYVGSFYYIPRKPVSLAAPHRFFQYDPGTEDWSYRSPLYFFKAWQALAKRHPSIARRIRFHHVGHTPAWLTDMASSHGVAEQCSFRGPLERQQIPAFLEDMSCLLATSMKRVGGNDYCLASKSFEYLTSGKPTLAFVCEGAQKRFFEGAGGTIFFDPDDPAGAAEKIRSLCGSQKTISIDRSFLKDFDLDVTAGQMARLIHRMVETDRAAKTHAT